MKPRLREPRQAARQAAEAARAEPLPQISCIRPLVYYKPGTSLGTVNRTVKKKMGKNPYPTKGRILERRDKYVSENDSVSDGMCHGESRAGKGLASRQGLMVLNSESGRGGWTVTLGQASEVGEEAGCVEAGEDLRTRF